MIGMEHKEIFYWNKAAKTYSSRQDELISIYQPVVDELLGCVSGMRILDAGCGDGRLAINLASRGATVYGIDGSSEMLALAELRSENCPVKFMLADLTAPLPFPDNSFDIVVSNMVLTDIPRIDFAISEFARLLTDGGSLVLSVPHPCFFCADWVTGENGQRLYKKVSDYLTLNVETLNFWGKTLHFHRPLSYYFDELTGNGFYINAFKEPMPSEEVVERHEGWECHRRVPSFVVMRAVLINRTPEMSALECEKTDIDFQRGQ
jgi:ubiquinone/menaquinone biosynthesis C-methylase UbiE